MLYFERTMCGKFEYRTWLRGLKAFSLQETKKILYFFLLTFFHFFVQIKQKKQKKTKKNNFPIYSRTIFFICLLYFIYLYSHLLYDVVFGVLPIYVVIILISFFFNTFTIQLFRSAVQFLFFSQILTTLVAKPKKI